MSQPPQDPRFVPQGMPMPPLPPGMPPNMFPMAPGSFPHFPPFPGMPPMPPGMTFPPGMAFPPGVPFPPPGMPMAPPPGFPSAMRPSFPDVKEDHFGAPASMKDEAPMEEEEYEMVCAQSLLALVLTYSAIFIFRHLLSRSHSFLWLW